MNLGAPKYPTKVNALFKVNLQSRNQAFFAALCFICEPLWIRQIMHGLQCGTGFKGHTKFSHVRDSNRTEC